MKINYITLFLLIAVFGCTPKKQTQQSIPVVVQEPIQTTPIEKNYTRNLIIYYDATTGDEVLLNAVKEFGAELIYEYKTLKGIAIKVPENKSIDRAIAYFKKVKGVLSVNRDQIIKLDDPVDVR